LQLLLETKGHYIFCEEHNLDFEFENNRVEVFCLNNPGYKN